eukprot:1963652-Rhodomonas_salina.2
MRTLSHLRSWWTMLWSMRLAAASMSLVHSARYSGRLVASESWGCLDRQALSDIEYHAVQM